MTEKQRIGYKVLNRINRTSAVIGYGGRSAGRMYLKNKKIKPKNGCGPLCVFDSPYRARYWSPTGLIVKCKYTPSIYYHIWEDIEYYKVPISQLPQHTVLADSVTCLE